SSDLPPSSVNLRFYSGAPPLEIGFYVFTRYFTPEMGAILLVNEALMCHPKTLRTNKNEPSIISAAMPIYIMSLLWVLCTSFTTLSHYNKLAIAFLREALQQLTPPPPPKPPRGNNV